MIRKTLELKEALKEWIATDEEANEFAEEIKEVQARFKKYVEDKEAALLAEIKALELDTKLAIKGAAKASEYKPADLKTYFYARAKESVDKVVKKGELFDELTKELE